MITCKMSKSITTSTAVEIAINCAKKLFPYAQSPRFLQNPINHWPSSQRLIPPQHANKLPVTAPCMFTLIHHVAGLTQQPVVSLPCEPSKVLRCSPGMLELHATNRETSCSIPIARIKPQILVTLGSDLEKTQSLRILQMPQSADAKNLDQSTDNTRLSVPFRLLENHLCPSMLKNLVCSSSCSKPRQKPEVTLQSRKRWMKPLRCVSHIRQVSEKIILKKQS